MWCFLFVLLFLTLVLYSVVYLDVTTYVAYYVFISKQNVIVPEKNDNYEFILKTNSAFNQQKKNIYPELESVRMSCVTSKF